MYDKKAKYYNEQSRSIQFDVPFHDMNYFDDCAYAVAKMLLDFHGQINRISDFVDNTEGKEEAKVSTSYSFFDNNENEEIKSFLENRGFQPLAEEITQDNLFDLLRSYGPFFIGINSKGLDIIRPLRLIFTNTNKEEGHAFVIVGVDQQNVSLISPSPSKKTIREKGEFAALIFSKIDSDQQYSIDSLLENTPPTKVFHVKKNIFMAAIKTADVSSLKTYYFPNPKYLDTFRIWRVEKTQAIKNWFWNKSNELKNKTIQTHTQQKFYMYMVLSKNRVDKLGLFPVIENILFVNRMLLKLCLKPDKPSTVNNECNPVKFLYGLKNDCLDGYVEIEFKKAQICPPDCNYIMWNESYLELTTIKAFYPFDELTDEMVDEKNNKINCKSVIKNPDAAQTESNWLQKILKY